MSSSFFAGRLLNCLHHEVKSRLDEAGSGVANGAGWGSPLRTRGVWGLVCVPAGMARAEGRGSEERWLLSRAKRRGATGGQSSIAGGAVELALVPGTGGPRVGRQGGSYLGGPLRDVGFW